MTRDVDFIVAGRLVDVTEWGAELGRPYSKTVVVVAVDEVLKGEPAINQDGTIIFSVLYGTPISTLRRNLPNDTHVLFLNDDDPFPYYLPADFQNVFVDVDGKVAIPWATEIRNEYGRGAFPLDQRGRAFSDLLDEIRRAASRDDRANAAGTVASLLAC